VTKRILLVDDEFSVLFAYKKVLQCPEVLIDAAESKEEALRLLDENHYQAAILDLSLHGSTGEEGFGLASLIREKYGNPTITIIMITAYGTPEIKDQAYKLGADYYFEKPVSTNTIRDALESAGITIPHAVNG
jgi:DNA-binding response OmpR family regulator